LPNPFTAFIGKNTEKSHYFAQKTCIYSKNVVILQRFGNGSTPAKVKQYRDL
jgi:hypothetical protein